MTANLILCELKGNVGIITINRPDVHNALNTPLLLEFEQVFEQIQRNEKVHVIVVTGAGDKAFVAGGDLQEMVERDGLSHYREFAENIHRVFRKLETCDKPTIAAVNGWALGGGTELMLAMDIRLLADNVQLALPEINLGLFPGAGGSQRLIRQIAPCFAKEMMFTGDRISAHDAVRMGLANRVVPQSELMKETLSLAGKIARKSPLVLTMLKRVLRDGVDMPLANALAHEQAMIGLVFDTSDAHEGMQAFLEKREPNFTGR